VPRRKIEQLWRDRVRELTEQNPRWSSRRIAAQLEAEGKELGRDDWPSEKTVRNIMKEHRDAPESERQLYRQVYWPESFGTPELPWEAAPIVLEAIRVHRLDTAPWDRWPIGTDGRPTVRTATWFWRFTLAAPPEMPGLERLKWARLLAACDSSGLPGVEATYRAIEKRLIDPESPPGPLTIYATEEALIEEGYALRQPKRPPWQKDWPTKRSLEADEEGGTES
jgi:hypothetical protein